MKKIERQPNMEYILSISYGKDSLACLGAIKQLDWPLDRIVTAEIYATETLSADLPPMVEFKQKADRIIKDRYGITVEHFDSGTTYEKEFYKPSVWKSIQAEKIRGWPLNRAPWCNRLKINAIKKANLTTSKGTTIIEYIGIAIDEAKRLERLKKQENKISPLAELKWTEEDCKNWCIENDLLSPLYLIPGFDRGGCWFCHNQKIDQLRYLRKNYPEYYKIMLKWDQDSPVTYRIERGLQDYEKRFLLEDKNLVPTDRTFRWSMIDMIEQELRNIEFNRKVKCNETGKIYVNVVQASLQTGIPKESIKACLRGQRKTTMGTTWMFVNEPQED